MIVINMKTDCAPQIAELKLLAKANTKVNMPLSRENTNGLYC